MSVCRHRMNMIRSLRWRNIISKKTTVQLYNTLIFSKLSYGMPAWLNLSQTHKRKMQVLQNDALRLANRATRSSRRRIVELHDDAGIPLVKDRFINLTRMYFARKSDECLLWQVKNNIDNPTLRQIGWHLRAYKALK